MDQMCENYVETKKTKSDFCTFKSAQDEVAEQDEKTVGMLQSGKKQGDAKKSPILVKKDLDEDEDDSNVVTSKVVKFSNIKKKPRAKTDLHGL